MNTLKNTTKANAQKNTLLKNAQANAESNFFKRVFFLPPKKNFCQRSLKKKNLFFQRTVQIRTDIASNVNRFVDSVCGHRTESLRGKSRAAGNKKINANFLFGGFIASYESWCVNEHPDSYRECFVSTVVRYHTGLAQRCTASLPSQIKNFVYPLCVACNFLGTLLTLNFRAFNGQTKNSDKPCLPFFAK